MTSVLPAPRGRSDRSSGPRASGADIDQKLRRLSKLSTERSTAAYDIPWDDPELAVEPTDPRLRIAAFDPLARSDWYRSLSPEDQARVGTHRTASMFRVGADFENYLQQALLRRVLSRRAIGEEARYSHHENVEESQHTLMFFELSSLLDARATGLPRVVNFLAGHLIPFAATQLPVVFFLVTLVGEEPVDWYQRKLVADDDGHPLVRMINRIHISEEARHVSYARTGFALEAAKLGPIRRHLIATVAPVGMVGAAFAILAPLPWEARRLGVPYRQVARAYLSADGRRHLAASLAKPRRLMTEHRVTNRLSKRIWRWLGADDAA